MDKFADTRIDEINKLLDANTNLLYSEGLSRKQWMAIQERVKLEIEKHDLFFRR